MLSLVFYTTATGNSPVERYIQQQDAPTRARILAALQAFREEFPQVQTVSIKHLRGKLWELRIRDARGRQHRLLYAVIAPDLVVLHAFLKKVQKTPPEALDLAERRLREVLE
jgi:phage-related protein